MRSQVAHQDSAVLFILRDREEGKRGEKKEEEQKKGKKKGLRTHTLSDHK